MAAIKYFRTKVDSYTCDNGHVTPGLGFYYDGPAAGWLLTDEDFECARCVQEESCPTTNQKL